MIIETASYQEDGTILAVIDGVTWIVPDDDGNRFRQALAEWEAAGNDVAPAQA